jgi:hypothetical protein
MAAILPHLEQEDETTELEARYWDCTRPNTQGLSGAKNVDPFCPTPREILNQSHSQLLQIAYTRQVVLDQLVGKKITPVYVEKDNDFALVIDEAIKGPQWNPMSGPIRVSKLLSWTSKMGAPSFSLPAGAPTMGGSCPGAMGAQSIVPDTTRKGHARKLLSILDVPHINISRTVCEFCYAETGNYTYASMQFHQAIRYAWVRKAIREDIHGNKVSKNKIANSAFVEIMIQAINHADFQISKEPEHWRDQRFFRLHDSGDFFDLDYLRAWKAIANHFSPKNTDMPITFWAPSRIWALGKDHINEVSKINGPAEKSNLVIRPSGFEIDMPGPAREHKNENWSGWYANTVVFDHKTVEEGNTSHAFDWNCQAYAVEKGPACREAEDPHDREGCRACWKDPNMRINYALHWR